MALKSAYELAMEKFGGDSLAKAAPLTPEQKEAIKKIRDANAKKLQEEKYLLDAALSKALPEAERMDDREKIEAMRREYESKVATLEAEAEARVEAVKAAGKPAGD